MTHGGDRRSHLMGELSLEIIRLARRPAGVTNAEVHLLCGKDASWVSGRMTRLVDRGHLLGHKVPGQKIHWFTTLCDAQAWAATLPPRAVRCRRKPAKPANEIKAAAKRAFDGRSSIAKANATAKRMRAQSKATTGTVIHAAPVVTKVTIPAHVKVQRIAAPAAFGTAGRLHVPDEPVIGGFASMGIGRYL